MASFFRNQELAQFQDRTIAVAAAGIGPQVGNVFYVNSVTGSSTNNGLYSKVTGNAGVTSGSAGGPFATLAQALAVCTTNNNDLVVVAAGHAETLSVTTQGVLLSLSGVTIMGCGNGRNRPAITCGNAAVTGISITGNSNRLKNLRIIQGAGQTKAFGMIAISGTDNIIEDCALDHGNAAGDAIITTAASRTVIQRCTFLGVGTAGQVAIQCKGLTLADSLIANNIFNYGTNLLKSAVIFASVGTNCAGTNILNNMCSGIKLKFLDIVGSIATNTTAGLCSGNRIGYGATLTLLSSATITPGDMAVMDQHEIDGKRIHPIVYGVYQMRTSVVATGAHSALLAT